MEGKSERLAARMWRSHRVISGDLGYVRAVAVDPSNSCFYTGSEDASIKIWDLARGTVLATLTGHAKAIRGLAVTNKHIFSVADDKKVKCWDLESNTAIRTYCGHLSGIYCVSLHPTVGDILLTGGRDSVCRVWDMRSKAQIFALSGHDNTVASVLTRPTEPHVITGSYDSTIKLWDLRRAVHPIETLTHHKKSVRALALHPNEGYSTFASVSRDGIKRINLPQGELLCDMLPRQKAITIFSMAVNDEGIIATGGDNGSLWFWDWTSGRNIQQASNVQPGSSFGTCIYALTYDVTGETLICCEDDKNIRFWKQVDHTGC